MVKLLLPQGIAQPLTKKQREILKSKIDKEARRAAKALNAFTVMIIATFEDKQDAATLHIQDGGSSPMPPASLLRKALATHEAAEENAARYTTPH
jgi:hypothetical protein